MVPVRQSVCAAVVALLAVAPPAGAADWRDGGFITDPDRHARASFHALSDGSGNALFTWNGYENVDPALSDDLRPHARARPARGDLTPPRVLSDRYEFVATSANDQGDLLVVSHAPERAGGRILVRSGRITGEFSDEQVVFETGPDERICHDSGQVGPDGRAIVIYGVAPPHRLSLDSPDAARCSLRMRMRASRTADFGPERRITEPGQAPFPVPIEFDREGRAVVAWAQHDRDAADATIRTLRVDPAAGTAEPQHVAVPAETAATGPLRLGVAGNGRTVIAFASRRPGGDAVRVAAAIGDTREGFGPASVLSGPAYLSAPADLDAAIGDDGTATVAWRAGNPRSYKVQAAIAGPDDELTSARTTSLSRSPGRVPQVTVGAGRATVAWIALVSGRGRSIEATSGRPGDGFERARVISETEVANRVPQVTSARRGAAWVVWGERLTDTTTYQFRVLKASKLSVRGGRFSRVLDVLRGRSGERIGSFEVVPLTGDGMLAAVERERERPNFSDWHGWWQLRTYGEGR